MHKMPYISIVTPVWNASATVRRTLEALSCQKASFEHVVYDGGSADNTRDIVREYAGRYPVRLMEGDNLGVYGNVANAHQTTTGEIMGWINGDDFYLPYTLAMVERLFRQHPEIDWITGVPSYYMEGENVWSVQGMTPIYNQASIRWGWHRAKLLGNLQQESMFWRRSLYDKVGGDKILRQYRYAGDFHLWKNFAVYAQLHTVRTVFSTFTIRHGQFSQIKQREYEGECGISEYSVNLFIIGFIIRRIYSNLFFKQAIDPKSLIK